MASFVKKIFANEFYKGGILLTISSFVVNFFNYIFNVFVGRSVGPTGYGEIATIFSYTAVVSIPVAVLGTMALQKISSADENRVSITRSLENYFMLRIKKWWVLLIPFLFLIPFIHRITNLTPYGSYVLLPLIFFGLIVSFYSSAIQGLRLFEKLAIVSVIAAVIKMAGPLAGMFFPFTLQIILTFLLLSSIYTFFANRHYTLRALEKNKAKTIAIEKRLASLFLSTQFWVTATSVFATTFFTNIDIIFIKKFLPAEEVGIYSAWMLFAKIILYIIGPATSLSFIYFASKSDAQQQNKTLIISLLCLLILCIGMFGIYSFFGGFIITVLLGNKFSSVVPFLGLAGIFGSVYTATILLNNFFLAKNSWYTILLPIGMIFYTGTLFLVSRQLMSFFLLNIFFGTVITILYLSIFLLKFNQKS